MNLSRSYFKFIQERRGSVFSPLLICWRPPFLRTGRLFDFSYLMFQKESQGIKRLVDWQMFKKTSVSVQWERFQENRKLWTHCGVTVVFVDPGHQRVNYRVLAKPAVRFYQLPTVLCSYCVESGCNIIRWGRTSGGVYVRGIYTHARWELL